MQTAIVFWSLQVTAAVLALASVRIAMREDGNPWVVILFVLAFLALDCLGLVVAGNGGAS